MTRQLDYYANNNVSTSNYSGAIKNSGSRASYWWLRSASSIIGDHPFYGVYDSGGWNASTSYRSRGVSPAFRLAE